MSIAYLIWSNEHRAWWKPERLGYTINIFEAGIYSREEALIICRQALGGWKPGTPLNEIPVRRDDLTDVIDRQKVKIKIIDPEFSLRSEDRIWYLIHERTSRSYRFGTEKPNANMIKDKVQEMRKIIAEAGE